MLRTIYGFGYMWLYLIYSIPTLLKWKRSTFENLSIQERDELVHDVPKRWAMGVVKTTGASISVTGEDLIPDGPVLFVSNHQGNFDIPLLIGYIKKPIGFISKIEVKKLPIISDWMEVLPCIFMDRKDARQSVRAMKEGAELLKKGHSMVIFPEGTRSKGGPVAPFKSGSFRLATKSGVPIVPITIEGSYRLFEEKGSRFQPGDVNIIIHPPIFSEDYNEWNINELAEVVEQKISSQLLQN
ncbi:1-acyl-sn-glycerol-3-phosphate acyltransferase [Bacillus mesophilus]|uniref:1-acyl-sn-glycerol-3-phosphate acyltransferase n=1 Tax=Bacillus mesophilus TaxID=1808955 RepID=A0A6M0QCG1_9BACI|nr:lysophospholipid acyltransferase family protein [Bacillus mesophilus]MBM7661849.1 1-acyl-sn-glycerol-3-phosphate acyltransferase [Bacillus mesophilus]NEY72788.1 1-acyl-sn-glycerol-3-phosphate acyltransferase [Bacillus mesophilus]